MRRLAVIIVSVAIIGALYSLLRQGSPGGSRDAASSSHESPISSIAATSTTTGGSLGIGASANKVAAPTAPESTDKPDEPARVFLKARLANVSMPNPKDQQRDQQDFLRKYGSGQHFVSSRRSYEILKLQAVPKNQYDQSMGPIVGEKIGYVIVPRGPAHTSNGTRPVVIKKGGVGFGIVSGTLIAKIDDERTARIVARQSQLSLLHFNSNLKIAYFRGENPYEAFVQADQIRKLPGVQTVTVEVVHDQKRL